MKLLEGAAMGSPDAHLMMLGLRALRASCDMYCYDTKYEFENPAQSSPGMEPPGRHPIQGSDFDKDLPGEKKS
jgi:hypothetical protein